jgi:hypothetical protein
MLVMSAGDQLLDGFVTRRAKAPCAATSWLSPGRLLYAASYILYIVFYLSVHQATSS